MSGDWGAAPWAPKLTVNEIIEFQTHEFYVAEYLLLEVLNIDGKRKAHLEGEQHLIDSVKPSNGLFFTSLETPH